MAPVNEYDASAHLDSDEKTAEHHTVVRIEHAVPDFDAWKQAFDQDPVDRKGSGVRRYAILRAADDPNYVMIDLEFDTIAAAESFLRTMENIWRGPGQSVMHSPRARIAERVETAEV